MSDGNIVDKAQCWDEMWALLKAHNPKFTNFADSGRECVKTEILRLQNIDTKYPFGIQGKEAKP
jgi:hypothetical protein